MINLLKEIGKKNIVMKKYVLLEGGIIMKYTGKTFVNGEGSYCMMFNEDIGGIVMPSSRKILDSSDDRKQLELKLKKLKRRELVE